MIELKNVSAARSKRQAPLIMWRIFWLRQVSWPACLSEEMNPLAVPSLWPVYLKEVLKLLWPYWSCGRLFKRSVNLLAGSSPSVQPVWVIRWILWLCQARVPAKLNEVMNLMATKSKRQALLMKLMEVVGCQPKRQAWKIELMKVCWAKSERPAWLRNWWNCWLSQTMQARLLNDGRKLMACQVQVPVWRNKVEKLIFFKWSDEVVGWAKSRASPLNDVRKLLTGPNKKSSLLLK